MNISTFTKKYALPLFVIAIISRSIEEINFIYYIVPIFLILFIFVGLKDINFDKNQIRSLVTSFRERSGNNTDSILLTLLLLVLAAAVWYILSVFWSDYPMVSLQRGLYFGLIAAGCILGGYLWMNGSGKSLLNYLLPANIIIVVLSIFSLISNIPDDSWTGGHGKGFMGFFGHQNQLGSLILFTVPAVFSKFWRPVNGNQALVNSKLKLTFTTNYLPLTTFSLLLASNLLILVLTYSRASWLSLAAGILIFLILIKSWKILIISFTLFTFIFILILSLPSINKAFNKIILKDFNTVFESRLYLWEPSLRAAKIGGLAGLGYGISEPNTILPGTGSHYDGERYVREKGNSFLALIEETGIIGLILFILPIGNIILKTNSPQTKLSKHRTLNFEQSAESNINIQHNQLITKSFLVAILSSFLLHSQFEAWMVGVGSVQLPLFFILLGITINPIKRQASILSINPAE